VGLKEDEPLPIVRVKRVMDREESRTSHYVKRLQLPSGKTIEVIRFDDPAVEGEESDLHRCRGCRSELVYPTRWSEADESSWQVTLRCPECELLREGVFCQSSIDAFDELLDAGTSALVADLRRLTRANMIEEGERFLAALAADAILPEDF
jgi:hypothetical protein